MASARRFFGIAAVRCDWLKVVLWSRCRRPYQSPVSCLVSPDRVFSAFCGVLRDALWRAWNPFQARQRGVGVVGFGRPGRSLRVPDADSKEAAPWTAKTARATCGSRTAMCSRRICGCWSLGTGVSSRARSPSSTQTAGWPPLVMLDTSACLGGEPRHVSYRTRVEIAVSRWRRLRTHAPPDRADVHERSREVQCRGSATLLEL